MTGADIVILVIIAISALLSLVRGFMKEALSLVTWIAAFWVSLAFTDRAAALLANWVSLPSARAALAFAGLFVTVLLLGGLVNYLIGQLVRKTGLGGTDRMLGMVFGVVRGAMVVAVLVLLAGLTAVPQDPWWQDSILLPHFERIALWLRDFLPPDVAADVHFD
ncbi:CvpA family protein [Thiohalobacter sp.]|uniref:CvpA family protein n=1 Tax=Thiohalobacter sp. TaxID=2025948 RepID=UPI00261EE48A|nr:CvpA family protein [Thiohalobacter sp.]